MQTRPFNILDTDDRIQIRFFSSKLTQEDLKWHFDEEDREIYIKDKTDWKFQFDNKLPQQLIPNKKIFIPKGVYHRLIKGTKSLSVYLSFL